MNIPRYLRADMERAFVQAYYRYVCGCRGVGIDVELGDAPWIAVATKSRSVWAMDFSSHYEFPVEMKPSTVERKMLSRTQDAMRLGGLVLDYEEGEPPADVTYEVWCFIPPSQKVLGAVEYTRTNGGLVTLVLPDHVQERVRQAALAVPDDPELDQAFVQAARMFRKAFGLHR